MSLVDTVVWLTLSKQTATSEATTSSSPLGGLWLEDRGTEGVLVIEDALLELIVGVLIAHFVIFVIIVVLAPVKVILISLSIPVE